ncbi:FtsB family cell division protein [Nocardia stercoris]|uniref:Septum formation initiator family protein n=1 Tax=Nocardia stercoris TaxID=2483361 RepID=A0A3M2LGF0_9NOCA|nr:septum formation initiator family protein [Nocardia stercoris]RMI35693.1 septum formation initiator family protein [Nocardia stercoris]
MTERRARATSPTGRGAQRSTRATRARGVSVRGGPRTTTKTTKSAERSVLGLSTGRAVLLAAVLCALALTLAVPMRTYFSQRSEATQLAQQRRQLESDLAQLRDRRAQQQDPAYIRSEARDRLRLVMPGETPYIVQVPGIEHPAVPAPVPQEHTPAPWYTQLWHSLANPPSTPVPTPEGMPR